MLTLKEVKNKDDGYYRKKYKGREHLKPKQLMKVDIGHQAAKEAHNVARYVWKGVLIQDTQKNSFDAIVEFKTEGDIDDECLIYKINNVKCNGGIDYVFNRSKTMAEITIQMDQDGPKNGLQNEDRYLEAASK